MSVPRFRIAPSPTGFFHVGGARTALYNWALARRLGGRFVLRVEDTDEARDRPEWTQGIVDALAWLGISAADPVFEGPYFQSANVDAHVAAAEALFAAGRAYYCDLTSEEIQARAKASGTPGYDGYSRDRGLGPGPGRVLRFRVPDGGPTVVHDEIRGEVPFEHDALEDFVLLRGNGRPMFLLANVVDDISMGITHVVRGEEHLPNTPKQQLLWQALGATPPVWAHVPVLVNEQRKKLSKRRDKVALEQYREEGYLAAAMVNYLMTLGWAPRGETEIVPWARIEDEFRLADVTHSPAYFDLKKLAAFNGECIRALSVEDFVAACEPWLPAHYDRATFSAIAPVLQSRVVTLPEAPAMVDFLFAEPVVDEASWDKAMQPEWAAAVLDDVIAAYEQVTWEPGALKEEFDRIAVAKELKPGKAGAPLRVAVTGRTVGPPMYESLELLGREASLQRLRIARDRLATRTPR
ncbi:MAG: glutamate--tRNA ligase [Actinomycetota bacterium]|nr:glutamate--tRNA ligase [Acidimicrobiia bacterium]MDQ3468929.1 glutamate--tRNA ligase [Actinomycetota bacterium]